MLSTTFQFRHCEPSDACGQFQRFPTFPQAWEGSSCYPFGRFGRWATSGLLWIMLLAAVDVRFIHASPFQKTVPAQAAEESIQQDGRLRAQVLLQEASQALAAEDFERSARLAKEAAEASAENAAVLQNAAELLYLSGEAKDSLPLFDSVVKLRPESAAHNWQRGIALCTCGDFERGAEQFKQHHDVNPDDVENSAWYFLCVAKTKGVDAAKKVVIPSRGDGRQPMMTILKLLQGEVEPEVVLQAAVAPQIAEQARPMAQFYADLYVGLYFDSLGNAEQAIKYLKRSQQYDRSGYMVRTAQVYLNARFPTSTTVEKDGNVEKIKEEP